MIFYEYSTFHWTGDKSSNSQLRVGFLKDKWLAYKGSLVKGPCGCLHYWLLGMVMK